MVVLYHPEGREPADVEVVEPAGDPEDPVCRYLRDRHQYVLTHSMVDGPHAATDPLIPLLRGIRALAAQTAQRRVDLEVGLAAADAADRHIAAMISMAVDVRARMDRHDPDPHVLVRHGEEEDTAA